MEKIKKIPQRKCVGCSQHFDKSELIRIVRTADGVIIDKSGKAAGRGAYICKKAACLKQARRAKRLQSNLECEIPSEVYDRLESELSALEQ